MGVYFAVDSRHGRKVANVCAQVMDPAPGSPPGRFRKRLEMMVQELLPEPDIGQLQFVATPDASRAFRSDLFTSSGGVWRYKWEETFDGWVFPDGSKFLKADFPEAYAVYGGESGEWFRVPNLANFFKLNPGLNRSQATQSVARRHVVAQHSHAMGSDEPIPNDIVIENAISVYESPAHGNIAAVENVGGVPVPYLCPGYNPANSDYYDFSSDPVQDYVSPFAVDAVFTSNALLPDQTDEAGTSNEAYPTHVRLPVLVYIGRRIIQDLS